MADHILGVTGNTGITGIQYRQMILAIQKEGDELSRRIGAISQFIGTEGFQALDILDKHLLTLQRENTQTYLHILTMRMARFDEAAKGVLPKGAGALAKNPLITPDGKPN